MKLDFGQDTSTEQTYPDPGKCLQIRELLSHAQSRMDSKPRTRLQPSRGRKKGLLHLTIYHLSQQ